MTVAENEGKHWVEIGNNTQIFSQSNKFTSCFNWQTYWVTLVLQKCLANSS